MGVGAGLYMYVVVVQKFTFAISYPDEFLYYKFTAKSVSDRILEIGQHMAIRHKYSDTFSKHGVVDF